MAADFTDTVQGRVATGSPSARNDADRAAEVVAAAAASHGVDHQLQSHRVS
jgi:hypothetical protein